MPAASHGGSTGPLAALLLALILAPFTVEAEGTLGLTFAPEPYQISAYSDGQLITMEGFGLRPQVGKPLLPARTQLFMLPPGAVVRSIEVFSEDLQPLEGSHDIRAAGPRSDLSATPAELAADWEAREDVRRRTYSSNEVYPPQAVEITAAGSLREYAYVAVTYHPFAYHPRSGRLELRRRVEAAVHYETITDAPCPAPDQATANRAERLFENFAEMRSQYPPPAIAGESAEDVYPYVVLTVPSLEAAVETSTFMGWKAQLGLNPRIVLTTDTLITSQPGQDQLEQIRNFLREYYQPWGIEYLLIVGSFPTLPMRYCYPDPYISQVPTDYYFADLSLPDSESWNLDGDSYLGEYEDDLPDFLAEIVVGRVPTNDPDHITYALDKTVLFEQDTGEWKDHVLHAGPICFHENMNHQHRPFHEGALCLDMIETSYMEGYTISHYSEYEGLVRSNYPWQPISESAFTTDWRNGTYGLVNWVSHGFDDASLRLIWVWDDGDGIFEEDEDGWNYTPYLDLNSNLDDDYPCVLYAVSCNTGKPETYNLGMALLTEPGYGAAAAVVCYTRQASASIWWPDEPGGAEELSLEFSHYLLDGPDGPERVGDAMYKSAFFCHVNYSWNDYKEYKDLFGENLYGDPSLERSGVEPSPTQGSSVSPMRLTLDPIRPNPIGSSARIGYRLDSEGMVRLSVYDASGRLLKVLVSQQQPAGEHVATWAGRSDNGFRVGSGLYLFRLTAAGQTLTRKAVLIN